MKEMRKRYPANLQRKITAINSLVFPGGCNPDYNRPMTKDKVTAQEGYDGPAYCLTPSEAMFIRIFAFLPEKALVWLIKQNQDYYYQEVAEHAFEYALKAQSSLN